MQPDAAAGNADDKKCPDFWHLGLASAKLFPHKRPCVPPQIRERAERTGQGERAPWSQEEEAGCVMCPELPLLIEFPFQPY